MTPKEELDDVLTEGMQSDIFRAQQALSLYVLIGQNSVGINDAHFGHFFGAIQNICIRYAILCTAKIFDPPSKRFKTRSLPVAFDIVDTNRTALPVLQHIRLKRFLKSVGYGDSVDALNDPELVSLLVEHYRPRMPTVDGSIALSKVVAARSKHIAHNERTGAPMPGGPSIAEIETLLQFAKEFLTHFAGAFISVIHQDDKGRYLLDDDARQSTHSAKRLLKALGIAVNDAPLPP